MRATHGTRSRWQGIGSMQQSGQALGWRPSSWGWADQLIQRSKMMKHRCHSTPWAEGTMGRWRCWSQVQAAKSSLVICFRNRPNQAWEDDWQVMNRRLNFSYQGGIQSSSRRSDRRHVPWNHPWRSRQMGYWLRRHRHRPCRYQEHVWHWGRGTTSQCLGDEVGLGQQYGRMVQVRVQKFWDCQWKVQLGRQTLIYPKETAVAITAKKVFGSILTILNESGD